jgi:outer membrane protein TolC
MKNFLHLLARFSVLALPILFLSACATPQMDLPTSIGPDIASRTGVKPAWSGIDSTDTQDGKSLRAAAAVALPNPLNEVDAVAIALDASPDIARMLAETDALRSQAIEIATPLNPVLNFSSGVPLDSLGVVPIFAMLMVQIDELWKQPIRSESARDSYEAALLSLGAEAVALANQTRSLWHELFLREQECTLATNDIALTEPLLAWARDRVQAGEGDQNGVAKAQSVYADALRHGNARLCKIVVDGNAWPRRSFR